MNYFTSYPHLYTPMRLGKLTLKNRIEVPPMGPRLGNPATVVSAHEVAYYAERARSGAAIVTVPDTGVDTKTACTMAQNYWINGKKSVGELKKLTRAIHRPLLQPPQHQCGSDRNHPEGAGYPRDGHGWHRPSGGCRQDHRRR